MMRFRGGEENNILILYLESEEYDDENKNLDIYY